MKKSQFFTIDGIIAAGIVFATIIYASSLYAVEKPTFHISYMSQDILGMLSAANIEEINNEYVNALIGSGDITNLDNTIIDQIVEFWANGDIEKANKTASNLTDPFVPPASGFGLWIDGEAVYTRDMPITRSLISSKRVISGIAKEQQTAETRKNPPTLYGPAIVEVRVWQ